MKACYTALIFCVLFCLAAADTLYVPGEYPTIQSAINAAINGDVIEVADGVYYENISFNGKDITVKSTEGRPGDCTIDGGQNSSCVAMNNGCTAKAVLEGFTITNGTGYMGGFRGAGLYASGNGFTVRNCVFTGNIQRLTDPETYGLSIYALVYDYWVIEDCSFIKESNYMPGIRCSSVYINGMWAKSYSDWCIFRGNLVYNCRGNIDPIVSIWSCNVIFDNNIIHYNRTYYGPPVYIRLGCSQIMNQTGLIRNNIIYDNWVGGDTHWFFTARGGGLFVTVDWQSRAYIINNTIYGNYATFSGSGIQGTYAFGGSMTLYNNIIWNNSTHKQQGDKSEVRLCHLNNSIAILVNNNIHRGKSAVISTGSGTTTSSGTITVNPKFRDHKAGNFHLKPESLCIDVGMSGLWVDPVTDFEGDRRSMGWSVDIGADEFRTYSKDRK
jgi:hypothetical protein